MNRIQRGPGFARSRRARFFFVRRSEIAKQFSQLFHGGEGGPIAEKWGWFAVIVALAGEDITKVETVERLPINVALSFLAYQQDQRTSQSINVPK